MARRTTSGKDRLSRTLGVFSLGLGTAQLAHTSAPTSGGRGVMAAAGDRAAARVARGRPQLPQRRHGLGDGCLRRAGRQVPETTRQGI